VGARAPRPAPRRPAGCQPTASARARARAPPSGPPPGAPLGWLARERRPQRTGRSPCARLQRAVGAAAGGARGPAARAVQARPQHNARAPPPAGGYSSGGLNSVTVSSRDLWSGAGGGGRALQRGPAQPRGRQVESGGRRPPHGAPAPGSHGAPPPHGRVGVAHAAEHLYHLLRDVLPQRHDAVRDVAGADLGARSRRGGGGGGGHVTTGNGRRGGGVEWGEQLQREGSGSSGAPNPARAPAPADLSLAVQHGRRGGDAGYRRPPRVLDLWGGARRGQSAAPRRRLKAPSDCRGHCRGFSAAG
jgi:hypothetical protein